MKASNTMNLKTYFMGLAKRLQMYAKRDPNQFKSAMEKIDQELERRPVLKKLFEAYGRLHYVALNLADMLNELRPGFDKVGLKDPELQETLSYAEKVVQLKVNVKTALSALMDMTEENKLVAKGLSYQDILPVLALNDDQINKILAKFKENFKSLKQDMLQLKQAVAYAKQEFDKKLQKIQNVQNEAVELDEAFEALKNLVKGLVSKVLNFTYRIYKQFSLVILTIDGYIQRFQQKITDYLMKKLGADKDPRMFLFIMLVMSTFGYSIQGKVINAVKSSSIVARLVPALGPVAGIYAVVKIIRFVSATEFQSYQVVKTFADSFGSALSDLDKLVDTLDFED